MAALTDLKMKKVLIFTFIPLTKAVPIISMAVSHNSVRISTKSEKRKAPC